MNAAENKTKGTISLQPLSFREAVSDIVKVKPEPKKKPKRKKRKRG